MTSKVTCNSISPTQINVATTPNPARRWKSCLRCRRTNHSVIIGTSDRQCGDNVVRLRQSTMEDFTQAVERLVAGIEKHSRILNDHDREVVAHHEMGHALVASVLPSTDPVHKVSIIPRGIGALGYTLQRPTEDRFLISTQELKNRMAVLLGGRAAEKLIFSEVSTGAADDLNKATEIARQMVTRFGMSDELGQAVYEPERHAFLGEAALSMAPKGYSEETAREIDVAVKDLIDKAFDTATHLLTERQKDLVNGAALLLEHETLTPKDFPPLVPRKATMVPTK